jgi:FkbM family methyltransferase
MLINHEKLGELYNGLKDELSQQIFLARLGYDFSGSLDAMMELSSLNRINRIKNRAQQATWREEFKRLKSEGKKIILYGAGAMGEFYGEKILKGREDFYAFCDRDFKKYAEGVLGKQVLSPDYIIENKEECYVVITPLLPADEIMRYLIENNFPASHVLPYIYGRIEARQVLYAKQYFEFPKLYPKGKAFVDAGCYRGETSLWFAKWCNGDFSEIFAFEPDERNFIHCKELAENNPDLKMKVFQAGVGKSPSVARFTSLGTTNSRVVKEVDVNPEDSVEIKILSIDDIVGDSPVGFIKMDIEGSEYDALVGAEKTIMRDKPLCAISVYHKPGDVLNIMDLLHSLVPEYRFWIRHYSFNYTETVLYAAI